MLGARGARIIVIRLNLGCKAQSALRLHVNGTAHQMEVR
jgi:hypothetical protein